MAGMPTALDPGHDPMGLLITIAGDQKVLSVPWSAGVDSREVNGGTPFMGRGVSRLLRVEGRRRAADPAGRC